MAAQAQYNKIVDKGVVLYGLYARPFLETCYNKFMEIKSVVTASGCTYPLNLGSNGYFDKPVKDVEDHVDSLYLKWCSNTKYPLWLYVLINLRSIPFNLKEDGWNERIYNNLTRMDHTFGHADYCYSDILYPNACLDYSLEVPMTSWYKGQLEDEIISTLDFFSKEVARCATSAEVSNLVVTAFAKIESFAKSQSSTVTDEQIEAAYNLAITDEAIVKYAVDKFKLNGVEPSKWLDKNFNWFFDGDLNYVKAFEDFFSSYDYRTENARTCYGNTYDYRTDKYSVAEYSHMMQLETMIASYIIEATGLDMMLADYGSPFANSLVYEDEVMRITVDALDFGLGNDRVDGQVGVELLRSDFQQDSEDTIFGLDELLEGRTYNANYMLRKLEWLPDFTFNDESYDYVWFTYTYCRGKSDKTEAYISKVAEKLKELLGCLKLYHITCNGSSGVVFEIFDRVGFKQHNTLDGEALNM